MSEALLASEPIIRLSFFFGALLLMALWETLAPRRPRSFSRLRRWPSNFGLVAFNTLALRLVVPTAAVGAALVSKERGWGLFNQVELPAWIEILVVVLILDLVIYGQHVMFHHVPMFWRLHRMHHTDLDLDVTSGARFHTIEILASMGIKLIVVAALGAPALGVLIFEVVLNATAMFNHANVRIPESLDRLLRLVLVTPDMHRVHHSIIRRERDSNFGFNLPWWDRLFHTYRDQPEAGHEGMTIGINQFRTPRELTLDRMLTQPFRDDLRPGA
ncbi:MAG: sterol desaturase family protein [Acidobacteria bacterium]|nr:sterol desaturase family protein [Acidobacteriota bacterium]MDA1236783.1 sterol desaturase family protein [Acidobacteriota bacterium]